MTFILWVVRKRALAGEVGQKNEEFEKSLKPTLEKAFPHIEYPTSNLTFIRISLTWQEDIKCSDFEQPHGKNSHFSSQVSNYIRWTWIQKVRTHQNKKKLCKQPYNFTTLSVSCCSINLFDVFCVPVRYCTWVEVGTLPLRCVSSLQSPSPRRVRSSPPQILTRKTRGYNTLCEVRPKFPFSDSDKNNTCCTVLILIHRVEPEDPLVRFWQREHMLYRYRSS